MSVQVAAQDSALRVGWPDSDPGLAAALPKVPVAGQLFGAGTLGILLLVAWSLASGIRLVSGR